MTVKSQIEKRNVNLYSLPYLTVIQGVKKLILLK